MSIAKHALTLAEIIGGCRRNDRRSQQALYERYCKALLSVCIAYTKNEDDAVEVLQDGFLKIFQQIHTFNHQKSGLYTWMRTIMVRTAIDALRRNAKLPVEVEVSEVHALPVAAEIIERMSVDEILYLVRQLPPVTRSVFQLYVQEGYTHHEIGELLNIREGTSKWHLSEARKFLSNALNRNRRLNETAANRRRPDRTITESNRSTSHRGTLGSHESPAGSKNATANHPIGPSARGVK
ncbi:MAG TPA: sigma-70 family RNA polymerase sigma factor [Flavisolibacter sp.]|nr:sigma-70 family RNA polymerase sigma factor [Flavisolibacter sp.]